MLDSGRPVVVTLSPKHLLSTVVLVGAAALFLIDNQRELLALSALLIVGAGYLIHALHETNATLERALKTQTAERKLAQQALRAAESKFSKVRAELVDVTSRADAAENATGVLHNAGNVLNSINVSTSVMTSHLKKSKVAHVAKAAALLREHEADLSGFFTRDPRSKTFPTFLDQLAGRLADEHSLFAQELALLEKNVAHVKDIVAMQLNCSRMSGAIEPVQIADLIEDALQLNSSALAAQEVQVIREFADIPVVNVEKHKLLQILINLVRNAGHACDDSGRPDKQVAVRLANGEGRVRITVADNGVGIRPEILPRIFEHGFTTKKTGHGIGLHSGLRAAREMGGELNAQSEGVGRGAVFTLVLPIEPPKHSHA
jgi:signal transduction histidine kinase